MSIPGGVATNCKSCGAEIVFASSLTSGKTMPIDVAPSDKGNIELQETWGGVYYRVVPKQERDNPTLLTPQELHLAHFVTCPYASHHRKGKG
jgi:hypothetical protein